MTPEERGSTPFSYDLEGALAALVPQAPVDFGLRVLRRVGIPRERYDLWVRLETAACGLYVAHGREAVTGAVLESAVAGPEAFEEQHWRRTRRTAVQAAVPFPGVRPALRTGRARNLPIDLTGLTVAEQAVLAAVRTIPSGQLRPIGWVARESGLSEPSEPSEVGAVTGALARNPVSVLIPGHRVTYDDGTPCDAGLPLGAGPALRAAEGIDMGRLAELAQRGAVFLGSDTTRIYCHPTCAHARRITTRHQQPFRTAGEARGAGYRACRSCRPVSA